MLASLSVADQGYITFLLSPEIRPHEPLCDWIVIAIVHMIVKQDAWLKGANIKLQSVSMPAPPGLLHEVSVLVSPKP